jgi:threonine/homoserine/homoserine lactone efflux protein
MITLTIPIASSLAMFAFVSSITPGPNNAMLLASGANFGFRATLPHAAGVLAGFLGLIAVCGLGLGGVFKTYPVLHVALKWGGAAYLLYLAFKIAKSRAIGDGAVGARPMTFLQAVAFQFINPKGWAMALGTVATYLPSGFSLVDLLIAVLIFGALNGPSILTWMGSGIALRRVLQRPSVLRAFNIGMGVLLALSVMLILVEEA